MEDTVPSEKPPSRGVRGGTRYENAKFKVSHWLEFESEGFEADTRHVDMRLARPIESILLQHSGSGWVLE